ncbi:MAG: 5-formyltetrahydrofolate cyclo-ligase [Clostridiales bacterium]|nr:5-formyltetrahydrofolate cyclo-ligase [Clostridiales bacterium]
MTTKKSIRAACRQARMEQSEMDRQNKSQMICRQILSDPDYRNASGVLTYIETQGEVSMEFLRQEAWKNKKPIAVPRVNGKDMTFYWIESMDDLEEGSFHILEPKLTCRPVKPEEDFLFLVPGVAYDPEGHRIGYGGGFYDRFLEKYSYLRTVGIGFDFQLFHEIPYEELDCPMDRVLTESGFHSKETI